MGKFAQRGLAESMARELHPQGVHVAWVNIDGGILNAGRTEPDDKPGSILRPEAIAQTYRHLIEQDRSAWTNEVVVRRPLGFASRKTADTGHHGDDAKV
jgi:NAD(P)-dependent dehydrogenase (short-subunit alcohol dehydrogenase family)